MNDLNPFGEAAEKVSAQIENPIDFQSSAIWTMIAISFLCFSVFICAVDSLERDEDGNEFA